jgi:2-polyprenyl-3-methyl-5-hydroxy-6-metoxy-1,4-benzoquinol methylase
MPFPNFQIAQCLLHCSDLAAPDCFIFLSRENRRAKATYQMSAKRVQIVASICYHYPCVTITTVQSVRRSYVVTTVDKSVTLLCCISVKQVPRLTPKQLSYDCPGLRERMPGR